MKSGVRQGGSLSPALFNVLVDPCITHVKDTNVGCTMGGHFMRMIMYADDILLLSPTVQGLQIMLDKCSDIFGNIKLQFNAKKSVCVAVGAASGYQISDMRLQNCNLAWSKMFKYLGVTPVNF